MKLLGKFFIIVSLAFTSESISAEQLAFPGAQGWGRYAMGARKSAAPTVYHVTNLNDSGSGSLRDAVSQPNRIVVFDVSGVIKISSRIVFSNNLYVAGQTAPGEGVTIYGDGVSFSGASNIICRYLRVRMGHNGSSGKDCAGVANGSNMIFDHCSFSWGLDETFSINGFGAAWNITLQNCIFGQGLMTHSAGGLMQADSITLYRNLYIDNSTRNNKVKGTNQYANNVVYNWSNGCYIMGGDSEGSSYVNIESNLFINGPSGGGNCFGGANADFHCYGVDNWQDANRDGVLNPTEVTNYSASDHRTTDPYDYPVLELYPGKELIDLNIPTVGASLPYRDQSDCYLIDELMSFGLLGALISNEETLPIGAPDTWEWFVGTKRTDTDNDGMPDDWEQYNGTDPNKADAVSLASNGYLNIENYINSITIDDRQYFLRKPITLSASSTTTTMTLTWRDYTYDEEGFVVEIFKDGSWIESGRTIPNATTYTLSGLEPGTIYDVRVRAFGLYDGAEEYSDYTTGTYKTQPVEVGIVDIDTYVPDVTNTFENIDGKKLLLHSNENLDLTLSSNIFPESVVATGKGTITLSGNGEIGGDGTSLNKGDEGKLIIDGKHSYTGATVLHNGVLEFNSIGNGGEKSAIGASQDYAQNWIMDGGTYRYTGANNATNRSAKLTNPTTLEIQSSTLTMNGSIEGSGDRQDFIFDGDGQLNVGSTSFFKYNGTTTIKGGTLYLTTTDISKAGIGSSSKLILAGGTLKTKGESSNYETYSFPIEVQENTYSFFAPNRNCYMNNTLTGAGTLEVQVPYLREYFNFKTSGFNGRIVANGVSTDSDGALMLKESSYNLPTTIVTLKGNAKLCCWATTSDNYLGGLSGDDGTYLMSTSKQTDGTSSTWTIGSANSDETFDGIINNRCCATNHYAKSNNINKVGTGTWRLTGKNVYAGTTNVKGGTLAVNGQHIADNNQYAKTHATAPSIYNVYAEATLCGIGSILKTSTINVEKDGTLRAGDDIIARKTFDVSGAEVTLKSGGILCIPVSYENGVARSNNFKVSTMNINSGAILQIDMQVSSTGLPNDTKFVAFSDLIIINGKFEVIQPAVPGEGQEWDLTELYSDGVIYVREQGYSQHLPTYTEENLFGASGKVAEDGFYYFTEENSETTQHYIDNGVISFDEAGKASVVENYNTDLQTGAIKLSKGAEITFAADGSINSLRLAFYRASGSDWGYVYGSYDADEWTLLASLTTGLTTRQTNYIDLTTEKMYKSDYRYIRITQPNGTAPTYLCGIALTYMQKHNPEEGIGTIRAYQTSLPCFDLQGRKVEDSPKDHVYIKGGRAIITTK
ncbi:MAG: fibronectin type III domain-containing protein [Bacteroidales bacterium]|nr:fibronectin type III domain-containing protein [Bacteroidales bacterium]